MEPKFNLTVEENVFIAKRNIVDYIWKSAKLEGLAVTFPETEAIYNGMGVSGVKVNDIVAINNLKHAWQFLFDSLDYPTNFAYISELNRIVGEGNLIYTAGYIRSVPVSIGGTSWKPDLPIEVDIKQQISEILNISSPTERAITLMLYCMRKQIFLDGNKRTSMLASNHVMIKNGCGIISVPIEDQLKFRELLIDFYESNDMTVIKRFVYDKCIDGIDMKAQAKAVSERKTKPFTL